MRIVASYKDMEIMRQFMPSRFDFYHQMFLRVNGRGRQDTCIIAPSEFKNYSSVIIGGRYGKVKFVGDVASPEEAAQIIEFMEQGGVIAITMAAFARNFKTGLGKISKKIQVTNLGDVFPVELPNHPLVAVLKSGRIIVEQLEMADGLEAEPEPEPDDEIDIDLDEDLPGPAKTTKKSYSISARNCIRKRAGIESLAGDATNSCYAILTVGKGKLILMPVGVLPDASLLQIKGRRYNLVRSETQLLTGNLFSYINPPRIGDVIRNGSGKSKKLVFWRREIPFTTTEGPEHLIPPYPQDGEELARLEMDVGRTEWERRLFFITLNRPVSRLSGRISELKGKQGVLNMDHAEALALMLPREDFSGPKVFLGKQTDLPPAGKPYVTVKRPSSIMWCLRVHVQDAVPGHYTGEVVLDADGETFRLPITVTVWPVKLDRRYIDNDLEHHFMTRYDYDEPKMASQLADYTAALDDYKAHWANWVVGGVPGYAGPGGILRDDGRDLMQAIESDPKRFAGDDPPLLDLSRMDTLVNLFIEKDITRFRGGFIGSMQKMIAVAEKVYGKRGLTEDSPETRDFCRYWLGEYRRYFREKGFPQVYTKIGDEWGESGLPGFLRIAGIAKGAGWRVVANPNQQAILNVPKYRGQVWPLIDCWWYAYDAEFLATAREMAGLGMLRGDEFWATQTSSFWWNIGIRYGYRRGWELSCLDFTGHHFHGWNRGPRNTCGAYLDLTKSPYAVFPCVGYELLGEGLEEGQYLAMFKEVLAEAKQDGKHLDAVRRIESDLKKIIGMDTRSLLRLKKIPSRYDPEKTLTGIDWRDGWRFKDFFRAKRELLKLTAELLEITPDPGPDLKWGKHCLVRDGRPVAGVMYGRSADAAKEVIEFARKKTGVVLKDHSAARNKGLRFKGRPELLVAIGARGERWLEKIVADYPQCGVTGLYPRNGSYLIYPSADADTILIYGGDQDGAALGCRALSNFLEARKAWKVEMH